MTTLRDYQHHAIAELRKHARDRPLLCLPTGAGKTSVAAEIIRRATERGHRSIFLVHRRELCDQAVERLATFGVRAGRIIAGHREDRDLPVQVASIPSLIRRPHWPADVVIVDECSHSAAKSWGDVLARYHGSWVIGLTATPIRLDGRGLGDVFGCIVEPVTTRELIDRGFLVEPTVYAPAVDLSGIRVRRGDYDIPQLAERMGKLTGSITRTWLERAHGKPTVVFAVNVEHSKQIVAAFRALGVAAEHLDGSTAIGQRAETLRRLRSGEITMVSNCMVLSEGWDLPSLSCAVLARPTKSLALFRQMVGRTMRPPGPVVVLDHAGNHHEHGLVTERVDWSLDGRQRRAATGPPVCTCRNCFAILPVGATECPECGESTSRQGAAEEPGVENPGQLVRIDMRKPRRRWSTTEKEREYRLLVQQASIRGYKLGWARVRYRSKFDVWPRFRAMEREIYDCPGHEFTDSKVGSRCCYCYEEEAVVQG